MARELSIEEVRMIKEQTDVELEVFIHGALCVSYSGQCLMSSRLFGRSGNKGACAQLCRFKYDLYQNDKNLRLDNDYLLSMKELCVSDKIKKLIDLGVSSLKIEGRMKSKYYVGYVTSFYRMLIDKYYNNEELVFSDDEMNNLLKLYNREFTSGFLNNDNNIVNAKTCNHQGVYLGKVIEIKNKLKIYLDDDLYQGDGIRFQNGEGMICNYIYNEKGLLVNSAFKGQYVYLDNKVNLNEVGCVYKTSDISLNKEIDNIIEKKIPVSFKVFVKLNEDLKVSIICENNIIAEVGNNVEIASNNPITEKNIIEKFSKLGNTPFYLDKVDFDMDNNVFIPIKNINRIRQSLIEKLIDLRQKNNILFSENDVLDYNKEMKITNEISFLVRNELQLKVLLDKNVKIYVEDFALYNNYKNYNVFYRPSRTGVDLSNEDNILVTNNGYLVGSDLNSISDIYMNVYNSLTLDLFSNYVYKIGLSPELMLNDLEKVLLSYKNRHGFNPNVEVLVYGKLELMLMKYCPIKCFVIKNNNCFACVNNKFYLDDRKGNKFRLLSDEIHCMRVMDYKNIDLIEDIDYLRNIGITNFRIDLLDETELEVNEILKRLNLL